MSDTVVADVIERLRRDLAATTGDDYAALVRAEAANARTFVEDPASFVEKVVADVQQRLHDEFVDTTWPRCPRHPQHPVWCHDGVWWCELDDVPVARLGELASDPAAGA